MSKYHFDNFKNDPLVDKIENLGKFIVGNGRNTQIPSNLLPQIKSLIGLDNSTDNLVTLEPGDHEQIHIDDLHSYFPDQPWRITRIIVHISEWEQGHFCNYGNHQHTQWKSGQVYAYDWQNIPHSMANASPNPIVTYVLTGIITEHTTEFINRLKRFGTYNLTLD